MTLLQVTMYFFLGRFLEYKELGIYAIFQLVFRLAVALFEPGMYVAVIQKHELSSKVFQMLGRIQNWLALAGTVILLLFFLLEGNYYRENPYIVLLSLFLFTMIAFGSRYPALLTRSFQQRVISLSQIVSSSFEFLCVLIFIWHFDPVFIFALAFCLRFLVFYLLCFYFSENYSISNREDVEDKKSLRYASYQVINQGVSFVQGNFDSVLVTAIFGLRMLGPYNFASEISYLLFSKINPIFNKASFPVLARHKDEPILRQQLVSGTLLSHALITLSFYVLLYFNLDLIVPLVFKDPEGLILQFSKFICVMAMIRSVNNIVFSQLLALGESAYLLRWNLAVLFFNYLFIAVIYFLKADINQFLIINIFVSFSVLLISLKKLLKYLTDKVQFYLQILRYVFYFSTLVTILIFLSRETVPGFFISGIQIVLIVGWTFLFYREKTKELFSLRIFSNE